MKQSAGLLVYKIENNQVKVLLGHMGGPFYVYKDNHAWDIPKGEFEDEDALSAAYREFEEEIGKPPPKGEVLDLGEVRTSGKVVMAWTVEGDIDTSSIKSSMFTMEWPPKSGEEQEFPEIDKAEWFDLLSATKKIVKSRTVFLERLAIKLKQRNADIKLPNSFEPEPESPPQQSLF